MKKKNLLMLMAAGLLLSMGNLWAQVPAHGSLVMNGDPIWTQTLPVPTTDPPTVSVQTTATMDYKVVTISGTTWVWMKASAGNFWLDGNSEFGYTTNGGTTATKWAIPFANVFGPNNQTVGSTTATIPAGAQIFMRPQINLSEFNGGNHTTPINYNPAALNSATSDSNVPEFPVGGPGVALTSTSITITLNATDDSGDLFYYIVNTTSGVANVVFTSSATYTFPIDSKITYTVYAVDFSGNASAPQTVATYNDSATELDAPDNLAISLDKSTVTFDPVTNASGYLLIVFDGSNAIYELTGNPVGTVLPYKLVGNLTVKVRALGDGSVYANSPWAEIPLTVAESEVNLLTDAQYCNWLFNPPGGNNCIAGDQDAAYITWETLGNGNIRIAIAPYFLYNGADQTAWRSPGINTAANITVNGDPNTGNKYFTVASTNQYITLTKNPSAVIPKGSHIGYTNGYIIYRTLVNAAANTEAALGGALHDLYPTTPYTVGNPYIYGSSCTPITVVNPAITCGNIDIDETSDGAFVTVPVTKGTYNVATIVFVAEDLTETPFTKAGDDKYSLTGLDPETQYSFSVYAKDANGNVSNTCEDIDFETLADVPVGPCGEGYVNIFEDVTVTGNVFYATAGTTSVWNPATEELTVTIGPGYQGGYWGTQVGLLFTPTVHVYNDRIYNVSYDITTSYTAVDSYMKFYAADGEFLSIPGSDAQDVSPITANTLTHFSNTMTPAAEFDAYRILWRLNYAPGNAVIKISNITVCEQLPTGVKAPAADSDVVKAQYFTIDGREVAAPASGLYIVKKVCKDGSVKTEKVFVK